MDQQLLFLINHTWAHPAFDRLMAVMSSLDFWLPFLIAPGGRRGDPGRLSNADDAAGDRAGNRDNGRSCRAHSEGCRGPPAPARGARGRAHARSCPREAAISCAWFAAQGGISVARIRPPRGSSFPSAHAANNFAVAVVCAVFFRRWGWLLFLPAILVAYSRVYVGSHWPLDVIVSCFLGAGVGLLVVVIVEAFWRRWGGRCIPCCTRNIPVCWPRDPGENTTRVCDRGNPGPRGGSSGSLTRRRRKRTIFFARKGRLPPILTVPAARRLSRASRAPTENRKSSGG